MPRARAAGISPRRRDLRAAAGRRSSSRPRKAAWSRRSPSIGRTTSARAAALPRRARAGPPGSCPGPAARTSRRSWSAVPPRSCRARRSPLPGAILPARDEHPRIERGSGNSVGRTAPPDDRRGDQRRVRGPITSGELSHQRILGFEYLIGGEHGDPRAAAEPHCNINIEPLTDTPMAMPIRRVSAGEAMPQGPADATDQGTGKQH